MLTKLILIIFLGYLVNKTLIVPFKKEFIKFFQDKNGTDTPEPKSNSSKNSLVPEEDIEDAEFKEIKD
ncbi:hypothetical protein KAJ27_20835 [bacterium]|nr:hypothetical protein [bacterium]